MRSGADLVVAGEGNFDVGRQQGGRTHSYTQGRAGVAHVDSLLGGAQFSGGSLDDPVRADRIDLSAQGSVGVYRRLGVERFEGLLDGGLSMCQRGDSQGSDGV